MIVRRLRIPARAALRSLENPTRTALNRVLLGGSLPISATDHPGDPGLLGPEAVSWEVLADPSSLIGGVRALLVQACHPLAMQGVADHSAFREDPLGRLQRTVSYVAVMTYGSRAEAARMAERVISVHDRVRGVMPDGRSYDAADPVLMLWVHCTLTESFLVAHRAYGARRLTDEEEDAFVREQASTVALLGVDAPRSREELSAAMRCFDPVLERTDATREASRFLLRPPLHPALGAAYQIVFWAAVALLEDPHRRLLGLPRVPPARYATRTMGRVFTAVWRAVIPAGDIKATAEQRVNAPA